MTPSDSTAASTTSTPEFSLSAGGKLAGCYLLRQPVDAGGGHAVWLAQDEVLGRDISLHFLPSQIRPDTRAMEEIRKEVKKNRQLIHPNILRVYDLIEEPEFTAISMDPIAGRSLASLLKEKGTLDAGAIQPWIGALCQTLEEAHKINLTHRDLAPSNIYLGADGKVVIAGFGISRCVQDALGRVTRGANPRLSYLSPQGADGQPAVRADDVYSLGMLLFELLTGELPFNGGDTLSQIKRVAAPRVSARLAASRRGSDLPASWDETIAASLRKDASQRPASALEFASKLEQVAVKAAPVEEKNAIPAKEKDAPKSGIVPTAKREEPAKSEPPAAIEAKPAATPPPGAAPSEPPPRKPVEILRERAAELARSKATGNTPAPSPAPSAKTPTPPPAATDPKPSASPGKQEAAEEIYPSLYPKRSRGPALALAAGVAIAAIAGAGYYLKDSNEPAVAESEDADLATTPAAYASEIRSVNHQSALPPKEASKTAAAPQKPAPVVGPAKPAPSAPEKPAEPKTVVSAPVPPKPAPAPATPAPVAAKPPAPAPIPEAPIATVFPEPTVAPAVTAPPAPEPILLAANRPAPRKSEAAAKPAAAPVSAENAAPAAPATPEAIAEKSAALEKLKSALQTSEQAQADLLKQQEQTDAAIADLQKQIDQKTKELAPMRKSSDDLQKTRKQREDAQKAAELDAQKAQQIAAEKARLAEEARKALADLDAQNEEKLAAQKKSDAEIATLRAALTDKQQTAAAAAKAATEAKLARTQQLAAVEQAERDVEQTKLAVAKSMAAETARKAREEAEKLVAEKAQERQRIESEIAAMKKMFEEKMKVLEDAQKAMSDAEAKTKDTEAMQKKAEAEALKLLNNPAASGSAQPAGAEKAPAPAAPPSASATAPAPAATLSMKTEPKAPVSAATAPPAPAKPAQGADLKENSLGMKFAPVGDVQFAIWQTRVKDFETFAKAVDLRSNAWKGPGFKQGPDHPVVNVTWHEAVAFCKWLTDKERKEGALTAGQLYRLPTDLEWSSAVGLGEETGRNPEARDMGVPDVYPWGTQWPPPASAGNYTGEETGSDVAIKGYDDSFAWTSPVGSFPPNRLGLYDMGGNVWQWVMDSWNGESKHKVLRGASWYNGALKLSLLSSCRVHAAPDSSTDNYGFRVVRASDSGKASR